MGTCGYWLRLLGPAPRTRASAGEKRVGISRTQLRSAKNAVGKSGPRYGFYKWDRLHKYAWSAFTRGAQLDLSVEKAVWFGLGSAESRG